MSELLAVVEGQLAARIRANKSGRLSLEYESAWRDSAQGYPLSVNMPLAPIVYPHKTVWPYLWNLLPENPHVLRRWAQQYHVSANNPFKLLTYVGADVPGAAQFISPEQFEEFHSARHPEIQWMSLDELRERLRQLSEDVAAVRRPGDIGKMSLPGVQAKTAYYWDPNSHRWGIPAGRTPTTHIIKPCIPGFDGMVENEHLCQDIASRLGMPAARSRVLTLDQPYIIVERYDRLSPPAGSHLPQRIHQEDLCQALGLMPAKKYQEDGGPNIAQIVTLLRRVSSDPDVDVERFLKANIFNWLIGGTDAHTKNYSLLIAPADEVRLAPLYDLSSQLTYPNLIAQRVAMKIGEHYDIARVGREDWQKLAHSSATSEEKILATIVEMAESLPNAISSAQSQAVLDGLAEQAVTPLAQQLTQHVRACLAAVTAVRSKGRPYGRSRKRNQ